MLYSVPMDELEPAQQREVKEDRLLWHLLLNGGARVGEVVALNVKDVNPDTCQVALTGKGKKVRFIQLAGASTPRMIIDVTDGRWPYEPLFYNSVHKRLTDDGARSRLKRMLRAAGAHDHYTPHCLRSYRATKSLAEGTPITVVAEQLGHSSVKTTQVYDALRRRVVPMGDDIPEWGDAPVGGDVPMGEELPEGVSDGEDHVEHRASNHAGKRAGTGGVLHNRSE